MTKFIHSVTEFPASARGNTPPCQPGDREIGPNQRVSSNGNPKEPIVLPAGRPAQTENSVGAHDMRAILMVSDDDYLRPMIRAFLEHLGFMVISCTGARHASEIVCRAPAVNLLLIDLQSSGSRGLELAIELAAIRNDLPAVILAACALQNDEIEIIESHAWKLLRKPLRLPELLAVIRAEFDRPALKTSAQRRPQPRPMATVTQFPASVPNPSRSASVPAGDTSNKMSLIWRKAEGDSR